MTRDRQVTGVYKLDEIEEQLEEGFIRCHQSYLVNADRVKCVTAKEVILHNDKAIPISRNRGKETKTALYSYIRSAVALGALIADNAEIFTFL
jgi:DNA-binding LytR/AlgR family response regulator